MPSSNGGGGTDGNGQPQVKKENARGSGRHQQKSRHEGNKNLAVKQLAATSRIQHRR